MRSFKPTKDIKRIKFDYWKFERNTLKRKTFPLWLLFPTSFWKSWKIIHDLWSWFTASIGRKEPLKGKRKNKTKIYSISQDKRKIFNYLNNAPFEKVFAEYRETSLWNNLCCQQSTYKVWLWLRMRHWHHNWCGVIYFHKKTSILLVHVKSMEELTGF